VSTCIDLYGSIDVPVMCLWCKNAHVPRIHPLVRVDEGSATCGVIVP
jgi:hypothetical protein